MDYEWSDGGPGTQDVQPERVTRIIEALQGGPKTLTELANVLDCGPANVDALLRAMETSGYDIKHQNSALKHFARTGGNHDASHYSRGGTNVVKRLCNQRDDCTYLGFAQQDIPLAPGVLARLWHPRGGVPYAVSYRCNGGTFTSRGCSGTGT